jgi:tRNA threonylcarbamoyladenosine biosynthesis protein TsaE
MEKILNSKKETKEIAEEIAEEILNEKNKTNVLALTGDLGSGKTTFTQFFARKLNIKENIPSPTFLIMRKYKLSLKKYNYLYHFDAYRIKNEKELEFMNFKKIIEDKRNIIIIEWAENIKKCLPKNSIWINFKHGQKKDQRNIFINEQRKKENFIN